MIIGGLIFVALSDVRATFYPRTVWIRDMMKRRFSGILFWYTGFSLRLFVSLAILCYTVCASFCTLCVAFTVFSFAIQHFYVVRGEFCVMRVLVFALRWTRCLTREIWRVVYCARDAFECGRAVSCPRCMCCLSRFVLRTVFFSLH